MKRKNNNRLYIFLMSTSMFLLLVFQFFWLKQNYQEQKEELARELASEFRSAVLERQDSLINDLILEPLKDQLPDSINLVDLHPRIRKMRPARPKDAQSFFERKDSFSLPGKDTGKDSVHFNIVKRPDGHQQYRKRFIRSLAYTLKGLDQNTISWVDFGEDSIRIHQIAKALDGRLEMANIEIPYEVIRVPRGDSLVESEKGLYMPVVWGDVPFRTQYSALFKEYHPLVLSRMLPLILFSSFLTLLTGLSFYLIYRSLKQQQRLTSVKNAFISNVTHELQTPITSVGVALEAISTYDVLQDKEKTQEYIEISKSELGRLSILVDKVLKMALFEENNLSLQKEQVDLKELINKVLHSMKLRFEQTGAIIDTTFTGNNFTIEADRIHLTSVLYNIIDNAIKYSNDTPVIKISVKENAKGLDVSVNDQGIGIPTAFKEKIFEKFFRVPNGDLHLVKGHGLGLSYVASILQKHNGKIEVFSRPGEGSTFTLALPKY